MTGQSAVFDNKVGAIRVSVKPLDGALVASFAFLSMLMLSVPLALALTVAASLLAAQSGLALLRMRAMETRTVANLTGRVTGLLVPVRHAAMLYAICVLCSGFGIVASTVASFALFAMVLVAEGLAAIGVAIVTHQSGFAALHVTESSLGLAGEID